MKQICDCCCHAANNPHIPTFVIVIMYIIAVSATIGMFYDAATSKGVI